MRRRICALLLAGCVLANQMIVYAVDTDTAIQTTVEEERVDSKENVAEEIENTTEDSNDSIKENNVADSEESLQEEKTEEEKVAEEQTVEEDTQVIQFSEEGNLENKDYSLNSEYAGEYQMFLADATINGLDGNPANSWYTLFQSFRDPLYYELTDYMLDDKVLTTTSAFWNTAFNDDLRKNPNYFYETILMGYLEYEQQEMQKANEWNTTEVETYYGLCTKMAKLNNIEMLEAFEENLNEMTVQEAADNISKIKEFDGALKFLGDIKGACSTAKEVMEAVSSYQTLANAKEERITILKHAREKKTDDEWFTKAVDDLIYKMEQTPIQYTAGATLDMLWGKFLDESWKAVVAASPIQASLVMIDIEKLALDALFNSSETASNNYKLLVLYTIDTYLENALRSTKDTFVSAPSDESARKFNSSYQAYIEYQIYGLKFTKTFIEAIVDGGTLHSIFEQIFYKEAVSSGAELKERCVGQENVRNSLLKLRNNVPAIYNNMFHYEEILGDGGSKHVAVTGIYFTQPEIHVNKGDLFVVRANFYPGNASNQNATYTSSDPSILEIPEKGGFGTIKGSGTVTITAVSEDGGHTATQTVVVGEGTTLDVIDGGSCGETAYWKLYSDGTLQIYGEGAMEDYEFYKNPSWYRNENIRKIKIGEGIKHVGTFAFTDCYSLTEVKIPESVTSIGESAFEHCSRLTEIELPKSITSIENRTFRRTALTKIKVSESVMSIGDGAFDDCDNLIKIEIPDNVTSIGTYAFYDCNSLIEIKLPENITTIEYDTFHGCNSLTEIELPESIITIGNHAFEKCESLTKIKLPKKVTSIGVETFRGCNSLTEIVIPRNVTHIYNSAFRSCVDLTDVYYSGTLDEWNAVEIERNFNDDLIYANIHYNYQSDLPDYLRGDVNEDNNVDIKDLRIVLYSLSGKTPLTDRQQLIADVTDDGQVTIQDLRKSLRYVCGKVESL